MTFNKAAFWGMKRRKALEKLLNHVRIPSNSGNHYYTVFFYNSTIQTPLIETIERLAKENGIPRTRVPALMAHELGFENSAVDRPVKQLRGFQRVAIKAGEETEVEITTPLEKLKWYDAVYREWKLEKMEYPIYVGSSAADEDLKKVSVTID